MKWAGTAPEIKTWLDEIADAYPDEEWLQSDEDDEFEPEAWHDLYFRAFDALQYDRFFGPMGGSGPIYYTALSRYARDHGIDGEDRHHFHIFMNAIDGEWLTLQREKADQKDKGEAEG